MIGQGRGIHMAARHGLLGQWPPWFGYVMVVEDNRKSVVARPVSSTNASFPVDAAFAGQPRPGGHCRELKVRRMVVLVGEALVGCLAVRGVLLDADEPAAGASGCDQGRPAASERVENDVPLAGHERDERLHQLDRLLRGMQPALTRLEANRKHVARTANEPLKRSLVVGAHPVLKDVVCDGGSDLVGLREPLDRLERRSEVADPPSLPAVSFCGVTASAVDDAQSLRSVRRARKTAPAVSCAGLDPRYAEF